MLSTSEDALPVCMIREEGDEDLGWSDTCRSIMTYVKSNVRAFAEGKTKQNWRPHASKQFTNLKIVLFLL